MMRKERGLAHLEVRPLKYMHTTFIVFQKDLEYSEKQNISQTKPFILACYLLELHKCSIEMIIASRINFLDPTSDLGRCSK